uniref:Uncharacterized protein n=1 Tax=Romanomermis culicivorax TaxID=13658 RepID=A0A915I9C3_ROMCU
MLLGKSPMKTPTQAPTDTEFDKETTMAIDIEEDVLQTDTTAPTTTAKTTSSVTPLSKSLLISQYELDWSKGEEYQTKATLTKTISMKDLSGKDDDNSKMDYLKTHPEDPIYIPPPKKCRDAQEETKHRDRKEIEHKTRERHYKQPSRSTTGREDEDYGSRKNRHGKYQHKHPSDSKDRQKKLEWASAIK